MSTLINKVWSYTPNEYTTIFRLTALFEDGSESVYEFHKSDSSWEVYNSLPDAKLVITVPDASNSSFRVRAYTDNPFISLSATYANDIASTDVQDVGLKRFVFDHSYDYTHPYYKWLSLVNDNPWNGLPASIPDIFLTNLTEYLTLPTPTTTSQNIVDNIDSDWFGWGILNGSYSIANSRPRSGNQASTDKQMPVGAMVTRNYSGLPNIPLKSTITVGASDLDTLRGNRDIITIPDLGNVYTILPIYNKQGEQTFYTTSEDYTIRKLTVNSTDGEVTVTGECRRVYDGWEVPDGGVVTVSVSPDFGVTFTGWSDGNTDNPRTLTVTSDVNLTAAFTDMEPGTFSFVSAAPQVTNSNEATAELYLVSGYDSQYNPIWRKVEQYPVSFRPGTKLRVVTDSPAGYGVDSIAYTYTSDYATTDSGGNQIFQFVDGSNSWSGEGYQVRNSGYLDDYNEVTSTTASEIDIDITIGAKSNVTISVITNNNSYGTVTGAGSYAYGSDVVVEAVPAEGYRFNGWNDGGMVFDEYGYYRGSDKVIMDNPRTLSKVNDSVSYNLKAYFVSDKVYTDAVTDYDGNTYDAMVIGDKVWMAENYKSTHAADGSAITDTYYPNLDESTVAEYGLLYDSAAALNGEPNSSSNPSCVQGIAPNMWHIPSAAEWNEAIAYGVGAFQNQMAGQISYNYSTGTRVAQGFGTYCYYLCSDYRSGNQSNGEMRTQSEYGLLPESFNFSVNGVWYVSNNIARFVFDGTVQQFEDMLAGNTLTTHTVTVSAGAGGSVSGSKTVLDGSSTLITATPDDAHRFVKWSDDNTDRVRLLTNITSDITLSAVFGEPDYFYLEAEEANSTVAARCSTEVPVMYSTDGVNFSAWNSTTQTTPNNYGGNDTYYQYDTLTLANIGDKVYFYCDIDGMSSQPYVQWFNFQMTGTIAAGGNWSTMAKRNGVTDNEYLSKSGYVYGLGGNIGTFSGCTSLTSAPDMPAKCNVDWYGNRRYMFEGCTFNMSDDGENFNFVFGSTGDYYMDYTYANIMGNTTGFNIPVRIQCVNTDNNQECYESIQVNNIPVYENGSLANGWHQNWEIIYNCSYSTGTALTITASAKVGGVTKNYSNTITAGSGQIFDEGQFILIDGNDL